MHPPPKYHPENWARYSPETTTTYNPFPTWAILLHGTLTAATCLLWLPIWGLHYALHPKTKTTTTYWH